MRLLLDKYLDVPGNSAPWRGMSLARHVYDHAFGHTGRNVDLYDFLALYHTFAVTGMTFVFYNGSLTFTVRTDILRLYHAENAPLAANNIALSVAFGARFGMAPGSGSASVTFGTFHVLADLEFLGHTLGNFGQCQLHFQTEISALVLRP